MFGMNDSVGKAFFKEAKPDELFITSRFLPYKVKDLFVAIQLILFVWPSVIWHVPFVILTLMPVNGEALTRYSKKQIASLLRFFKLVICQHPPGQKAWQKKWSS